MVYRNVLEYCRKNNLTIRGFEKMCGIGNGVVAEWGKEDNPSNPSLPTLEKIFKATGIPIEKWLSREIE